MFAFEIVCEDMFITENDYRGFVAGKEKSFERIFFRYYRVLVSFAEREGLDRMEAEDIALDVLHYVWEIRAGVMSAAALHTLIYTAMRHRVLNHIRDEKIHRKILQEHWETREDEEFYDHVMDEEMCRILHEAISKLPTRSRHVILFVLQGKSVTEIAEQLSISVNSVKTYKLRAINSLRESLKNYPLVLLALLSLLEK